MADSRLELVASSYCYTTREADPNDSWGRDSTARDWTVEGVRLVEADGQKVLGADFPVEVGDNVHVVYAVYSTGDTFGSDEGAYLEFISAHKNYEVAQRNLREVEKGKHERESYSMVIEFDSGAKVSRHCPWDGYFESLDYVRLETFTVQGSSFTHRPQRGRRR